MSVLGLPEPYFLYMHHAYQSVSREAAIRETRVNYAQADKLGNVPQTPGTNTKQTHQNYSSDNIEDASLTSQTSWTPSQKHHGTKPHKQMPNPNLSLSALQSLHAPCPKHDLGPWYRPPRHQMYLGQKRGKVLERGALGFRS